MRIKNDRLFFLIRQAALSILWINYSVGFIIAGMLSIHPAHKDVDTYRIEVFSSLRHREKQLKTQLKSIGLGEIRPPKIITLYYLSGEISLSEVRRLAETLILDPVTESYTAQKIDGRVEKINQDLEEAEVIEVAFRPGVTDNIAHELLEAAKRSGIEGITTAGTATRYQFERPLPRRILTQIAGELLANETIQRFSFSEIDPEFVSTDSSPALSIERIEISSADENQLLAISQERRLALDLQEMRAVQDYFKSQDREPTDAELETLAQTWSEHCVHKTFKGKITLDTGEVIDGIIYQYLKSATDQIDAPFVRSAFVDNAGVIAFDEEYDLSFKVETHNHPSAIEPFGGANTGVGGVVRDVLGVSHRPIANTDVLCFGPQEKPHDELPEGVIHPRRIREGVVAGVGDYGNKLGIPTVNGAVLFHEGYTSNPLVFCGCVGFGPVDSHPSAPQPGDLVVLIGGKTGRDGLRGATFSSLTMDAQTGQVAGASVQIGDPISEKGLIEVVERARDLRLNTAITDCGAGGLSSAVGEMSSDLGVRVDLEKVSLKYAGLAPWEIWLSEAQERMVLAVPPEHLPALQEICDQYWVELSDIGQFEDTGELVVRFDGAVVVRLENEFLHHGIPQKELTATFSHINQNEKPAGRDPKPDFKQALLCLLAHPNIASKEEIIRQYDHEVRGATVVKPFAGKCQDGPSDAAVLKPLEAKGWRGFVLANGINPLLGQISPYFMALSAIDEALRNLVAVGGDPDRVALLDNFCWGDPSRPEVLGGLVEAARGCHDGAIAYQTPFISGKDSLNNEFIGQNGERQAIPGTLLISSIGIIPDIRSSVTMDLKQPGDLLYLVGDWQPTFAGSHMQTLGFTDLPEDRVPKSLSSNNARVYQAIFKAVQQGLISAMHDLSEGGFTVALAEMCIAGRLGAEVDHSKIDPSPLKAGFAETNGCLIASVCSENQGAFESRFEGLPFRHVGKVSEAKLLTISNGDLLLIQCPLEELLAAFMGGSGEQYHG
jgi:phosphoribosylformylglycinamidine synthase II